MKAVVLGMSEPPLLPKYRQAATITTSNATMAIRSVCLGSCPLGLIFQRIVFDLRNKVPNQINTSSAPRFLARQQCAFRLKAVQQIYGELTPRHRPNRHGRYHRAPAGLVSGTLSIPEVPQGWQRNSRAKVIQPPAHSPNRSIASSP